MPSSTPTTTSSSAASATSSARLYYDNALLDSFSANVVELSSDGLTVYLNRSAFYPTSGGQPHDTGSIADAAIVDVVDEGERVAHRLAEPLGLPVGSMVVGRVDMRRRHDHMQQHTGQHLLSALLADTYGWPTVSVHFGDTTSTVDVEAEGVTEITNEKLIEIEERVNAMAASNAEVIVSYEEAGSALGLRKASDREGLLRIITIQGYDRSACGGTHVSNTGEIGAILIRGAERTRGHWRLEFVCGNRAIACARRDAALLAALARPLTAAPQDLPAIVEQMQSRLSEAEKENRKLKTTLAKHEAAQLWGSTPADSGGIKRIRLTVTGPIKAAEALANELIALGQAVVLATSKDQNGVLFAASKELGIDAGKTLRGALETVGGKGGGSPQLAQGSFAGDINRDNALDSIVRLLGFDPSHHSYAYPQA